MENKGNNHARFTPLLQWICMDSLAWVWGNLGLYLVIILLLLPFHPPWDYDAYGKYSWKTQLSAATVGQILLVASIIAASVGGAIFGAIQRSFLRLHFGRLKGWVMANLLGWILGVGFMAAFTWWLSSTTFMYGIDRQPIPANPIRDFSISGWLGSMAAGAALGSILAGLVQGMLLHKSGRLKSLPVRCIYITWPLTTILGMISGWICAFCIENIVGSMVMLWADGSRAASMLRSISPLWPALLPGAALAFFTGIPILKVIQSHTAEVRSSAQKRIWGLLVITAIALCAMAIFGLAQIGMDTGGWLDRALGVTGVERDLKGDARAESLSFTQDSQLMTSLPILAARFQRGEHHLRDEGVKIWEVSTGKLAYNLSISDVACLALSPNGELLATGGYHIPIELWSLPDGRRARTLFDPNRESFGPLEHMIFSSDNRFLASSRGSRQGDVLQMWRLSDGALLGEITVPQLENLIILPDGQSVLFGTGNGKVWRWDPPYKQPILLLENLGVVKAMDISADGLYAAIASSASPYDGSLLDESPEFPVQVWRIADGALLWSEDVGPQDCLDISPNGRLIATSSHNPVSRYEDPIHI